MLNLSRGGLERISGGQVMVTGYHLSEKESAPGQAGLLGFRYDGGGFGSIEQGYDANHDAPFSGKLL